MLLKTLASFVALGLVASAVSAAPSDSLGYAESGKSFKISRASQIVDARATALTQVKDGDRIEAAEKPVRVQMSAGNTVMVQEKSSAEFVSTDALNVVSGDVLVAIAPNSAMNVTIGDLVVAPMKAEGSTSQHLVAVKRVNEGRVVISGFNQPLNVSAKNSASQLAVIGDRDTMEFAKTEKGWVVVQADEPKEEDPADGGEGEGGEGEEGDGGEEQEEEEEERRGAFWWWVAGIGAATGAGVIIYNELDDDDDDHDDDRGPTSRITDGPFNGDECDKEEEVPAGLAFSFF